MNRARVDDLEAQALVDQLLHRHRPGRRARREGSRPGGRRIGGVLLRARNPHPGLAVGRRHPHVAHLVGLTDVQRAGGGVDAELVARWLDDGLTLNASHGRAFGERGVHGFDLTFCAPKSVSLIRALRTDDVVAKAIADAHAAALSEAMEYLAAHAGYTPVHNPRTGEKNLVRLPGFGSSCLPARNVSVRRPASVSVVT